jgi:hypothetical protein
MTNPNSSYGQLLTTTLNNSRNKIEDNVINNHPLFSRLKAKGNVIKESGGASFQEKLSYASNGTVQFQDEYDIYDTTPQDVITTAEFAQKILTGTVTMTNKEMLQNAGKERLVSLLESKMKVLESSLQNQLGTAIYADGTGSGGKEIGGLQSLVADDPTTGTVGGIDRSASNGVFWRNQLYDFSVESETASATTIQSAMNELYTRCQVQQGELPDIISADSVYFSYYENSLQTIQRLTDPSKGTLGFNSLAYKNAEVFYDPECPANHMYFLNTNHLFLKYLGSSLFVAGEATRPVNQGAWVTPMESFLNMTIDNGRVHGVMIA